MKRVVAAAVLAVVTALPAPASLADGPSDQLDPNTQGSLVDVGNALNAVRSDAGMSDGAPASVGVNFNGCSAAMLKPATEADPTSPTNFAIASRFSFQCLLAVGGTNTFSIEYSTLDGWKRLVAVPVTVSGDGGIAGRPISAPCRSGTWHYRGRATGTVSFVTASTVATCTKVSDPLYIDPA